MLKAGSFEEKVVRVGQSARSIPCSRTRGLRSYQSLISSMRGVCVVPATGRNRGGVVEAVKMCMVEVRWNGSAMYSYLFLSSSVVDVQ
jgi:hypothetical protein